MLNSSCCPREHSGTVVQNGIDIDAPEHVHDTHAMNVKVLMDVQHVHSWLISKLQDERRQMISQIEASHRSLANIFLTTFSSTEEFTGPEAQAGAQIASRLAPTRKASPNLAAQGHDLPRSCDSQEVQPVKEEEIVLETKAPATAGEASPNLADELLNASLCGESHEVHGILQKKADPNAVYHNFDVSGKTFLSGMPLAISALRGKMDMTRTLLEHGARVDSHYSFSAGALKMEVTFPASHAAVNRASIDVLRLLFSFRADINASTSLGGNLLWQSAYSGHAAVVEFLLQTGVDMGLPARSQDDLTQLYTPTHAAALCGHTEVVCKLLAWKADPAGKNAAGNSPLVDAIIRGHGAIVRNLVASSANLKESCVCRSAIVPSRVEMHNRAIDVLFAVGDGTVVANAALGLQSVGVQSIGNLTTEDFSKFLKTAGEAPRFILEAVMREHQLRYWNHSGIRQSPKAALVGMHHDYNVAFGPHVEFLDACFEKRERLTENVFDFIDHLVPQPSNLELSSARGFKFVPGDIRMCHVSGVGRDDNVLQALKRCPLPDVFMLKSAQVIIDIYWHGCKSLILCDITVQALDMVVFCSINFVLMELSRDSNSFETKDSYHLISLAWGGIAVWLCEILFETARTVGYCASGHLSRIACNPRKVTRSLLRLSNGFILGVIVVLGFECKESVTFNVVFGLVIAAKWMLVFRSLRGLRSVGMNILPIFRAMQSVAPFFAVVAIYTLAFFNVYYALGLHSIWKSFNLIFRIAFLGDIDWEDLEGVSQALQFELDTSQTNGTDYHRWNAAVIASEKTEYHYIVYILAYCLAILMGISLMNIYIAVLSNCYEKAWDAAESIFFRARTEVALDAYIVSNGLSRIRRYFRARLPLGHGEEELESNAGSYLWYFSPRELVS